jgi:hypothetical protein
LLEYKAFIPYDNVPSPAPGDVCIGGPNSLTQNLWYAGDYRRFNYLGTHRVQETAWAVPNQSRLASGIRATGTHVGQSDAYADNGMLIAPESVSGRWIDLNISDNDTLGDCDKRVRRGVGVIESLNGGSFFQPVETTRTAPQSVRVHFSGKASNPIAPMSWIGPIRWDLSADLLEYTNPGQTILQYSISGAHTCFPTQEIWADSNRLYWRFPDGIGTITNCLVVFPMQTVVARPDMPLVGSKMY